MAFSAARDSFLEASEHRNKPGTTAEYHRLLHSLFSFAKPIADLARDELMNWIALLADTPSEQDHAFVALRTMMNWCVRQGIIDVSPLPMHRVRANACDRVLSEDEVVSVLQVSATYHLPYGPILRCCC